MRVLQYTLVCEPLRKAERRLSYYGVQCCQSPALKIAARSYGPSISEAIAPLGSGK